MEKESVDDCLSYFSILGCEKESIIKSDIIQKKIGDSKNKEYKIKNAVHKSITHLNGNSFIKNINYDNNDDDRIEVEKEKEVEDDITDFTLLENSDFLRIPSVPFEKWYNEYFNISPDINPLDQIRK